MKPSSRNLLCLLLSGVLLLSLAAPALAAGEEDAVHLRTAEDLEALSRSCTLDSWSQGKTVYLEADIDLTGRDFAPIPTFGGTFQGQGHTISGLSLTGSGNVRGLFRYIQPSGAVYDLTVKGSIAPSGRKSTLGLLAGSNRGALVGCTARGTVTGTDRVGGLVGINEGEGQIINCAFSGSVTGEHYGGGIAGQNCGAIIQCRNSGSINTTEVDTQVSLEDLNREQLNAAENVPVCTDIGGIAGSSTGILQSCVNTGAVGYAHVGYNIGGIVGRQSGYLDGCANDGPVLGRKDVGGIAGQMEPEVRLLYRQGDLGSLLDELDTLQSLAAQTGDDLRGTSDAVARQMDAISAQAKEARTAVGDLADTVTDWTNGNIGQVNSLTARISWLTGQLSPILEDAAGLMDLTAELAGQLDDALEEAGGTAGLGEREARALKEAVQSLRQAADAGKQAADDLRRALDRLKSALGGTAATQEALEEAKAAAQALNSALRDAADALRTVADLLWQGGDQEALGDGARALADALEQAGEAAGQVLAAAAACVDAEALGDAGEAAADALAKLKQAADALQTAAGRAGDAASLLLPLLEQLGDLPQSLRAAAGTLETLAARAAEVGRDLADVCTSLAELPTVSFTPLDSAIQAQGDAVGDAFSRLLEEGDGLRETLSASADTLLDDLDAINRQLGVVTDRLRALLENTGQEPEDRFEDVSDQETGAAGTGTVANSRNTGAVAGDINVAGIVGSMAIEYDFDPEDDLIREGERSLDFQYQTRAVTVSCVNTGDITGKQDYTGGVVGRMDLGRTSGCENYGTVTSTSGDYVGGIAGAAWGSIRDCWSKCLLSGGDYVGGVAGLGATVTGCRALVTIQAGEAYLGAVAGDVSSGGTVSGNLFTSDVLGGLDGISYAGQAEGVSFDTLCAEQDAPASFSRMELVFTADGVTLATIPFQYGQGIDTLPEIPAKAGCSAAWPDLDYAHLTACQTLEAVYTPYTSALTDGGALPELLVDGSFSSRASVTHTWETVSWTDSRGTSHTGEACTVTVEDPALEQVTYTVHYRLADPDRPCTLWVWEEAAGWIQADCEIDGQYLLLRSQGSTVTFCVTPAAGRSAVWAAAGAGGLLLLAACVLLWKKRKRR